MGEFEMMDFRKKVGDVQLPQEIRDALLVLIDYVEENGAEVLVDRADSFLVICNDVDESTQIFLNFRSF